MKTYIVWMEMDLAKVFKTQPEGARPKILRRTIAKHHTSRDPENQKNCEKFFQKVAQSLKDADEVYLVGPGLAKEHFKAYLEEHHQATLRANVVGTETADHISDPQILALSRKFFKEYDLFGKKEGESKRLRA